jgi:hypothetical protein
MNSKEVAKASLKDFLKNEIINIPSKIKCVLLRKSLKIDLANS